MPDSPKDTTNNPTQSLSDAGPVTTRDDSERDVQAPEPKLVESLHDANSKPTPKSPDATSARAINSSAAAHDHQNDSEAETEKLSEPDNDDDEENVVKAEGSDGEAASHGSRKSPQTPLRDATVKVNGLKAVSEESRDDDRSTTAVQQENHRRKSSGTISSAPSWTSSARTKQDARPSPSDAQSPPPRSYKTQSPSGPRARSNSLTDSRKRKLRDETHTRILEPPRQKQKSEGAARDGPNHRQQPTSPATAQNFRQHRRSASTQSVLQSTQGRKRRDTSSLIIQTHDPKEFSDYSSDEDSSPRRPQQPKSQHARLKRTSHRSLTSPARAMPPKKDTDRFGATKLAREAERGDIDQVKAAYDEKQEDLDRADFAGIAPLQKAALNGHADVVRFLISKGCKTNCQSENRDTPLIDAVENGHIEVVKLLLREGKVNPHHQNKKGQRAIDVLNSDDEDFEALEKELKDAMLRETDTSANVEPDAAQSQNKQSSSLLYNEYNTETLKDKAAEGNARLVEELLNSNIKPNIACGVAAARGGHHDILNVFLGIGLKPDPDPLKHSDTYMIVAIGRGHVKVIELLLKQESFDPTRRTREGLTYWELAEQRHGPKWEQERKILKDAYDDYLVRKGKQSPNRTRKQVRSSTNSSPQTRIKRRPSPRPSERSTSPVSIKTRRIVQEKSTAVSDPPKRNRMMTGKELSTQRDAKRRRRVVEEESSSDDDVANRRPTKKLATKARAASEGEEQASSKTIAQHRSAARERSQNNQGSHHATSDDSGTDSAKKRVGTSAKQRHSVEPSNRNTPRNQPTPAASSDAESHRKSKGAPAPSVTKIKSERPESPAMMPKISKSVDKPSPAREKTPIPKAPSRTPTPVREERLAEVRRKEEIARREAEEARLKQEEARRKEEEEQRRLEEERRQRELAEERRVAKEEAAAARRTRLQALPLALRWACEKGLDRPLHFSGDILGITQQFYPIHIFPGSHLDPTLSDDEFWMISFQAVGVLGLPELDIAQFYPNWERLPISSRQRDRYLNECDCAALAQVQRFPKDGMIDFNDAENFRLVAEAREQARAMDPVYWIKFADFQHELRHGGLSNGTATANTNGHAHTSSEAENGNTDTKDASILNGTAPAAAQHTPEPEPTAEQLRSRTRAQKVREMLRVLPMHTAQYIRIRDPEPEHGEMNGVNGDSAHEGVNGNGMATKTSSYAVKRSKMSFVDFVMNKPRQES